MLAQTAGCRTNSLTAGDWFALGIESVNCSNDAKNFANGAQYFEKAKNNYFVPAEFVMDNFYSNNSSDYLNPEVKRALECLRENDRKGLSLLKAEAEAGNAQAQLYYGFALYYGLFIPEKDHERGLKYLKQAADSGVPYASFYYACTAITIESFYYMPNIISNPQRYNDIVPYLLKDANKGYAPAQCMLGQLFYKYDNYNGCFKKGAEYYLGISAEQNYPPALYMKGWTGELGQKYGYIKKASDLNFAPAQFSIGDHLSGNGQHSEGIGLIEIAAKNGDINAKKYIWENSFWGKAREVGDNLVAIFIGLPIYIVTAPIHVPLHYYMHKHGMQLPPMPDEYKNKQLLLDLTELQKEIDKKSSPLDSKHVDKPEAQGIEVGIDYSEFE